MPGADTLSNKSSKTARVSKRASKGSKKPVKVSKKASKRASKGSKKSVKVSKKASKGSKKGSKRASKRASKGSKRPTGSKKSKASKAAKRKFTVVSSSINKKGGSYTGSEPGQAANKAATQLYRKSGHKANKFTFEIRECTRGSKKDTWSYSGTVVTLKKPRTYVINGVTMVQKTKIDVKANK